LGRSISGVVPAVKNEGVISLQEANHPALVLQESINVVGSDISLGVGTHQGLNLT
jgi:dsDNA-specific endonuclease/ATPase MutS2